MSKNLKFLISIFTIIFIMSYSIVSFAAVPDMNLTANTTTNEITSTSVNSTYTTTSTTNIDTTTQSTSITNLNPVTESGLGITNILNILLIAVGVVLILLGIAIIIKIK